MEMKKVYEILGKHDRHILASHISHLREICEEILWYVDHICLEKLVYSSYAPSRLRGVAQILNEIYKRFECSVNKNKIDDINVRIFKQNLSNFVSLVTCLENSKEEFLYNYKNNSNFIKYTYDLSNFLQKGDFYVEDLNP